MGFQKGNTYGRGNKGHPDYLTKEQRFENGKKISLAKKGVPLTKKQRNALKPYWDSKKGKGLNKEQDKNLRQSHTGENHYKWRGGITPFRIKIWHSPEYQSWRKAVFERDKYTCVLCGKRGGKLNADHIKPFALFPELRLDIKNGRTLCLPCHFEVTRQQHKEGIFIASVKSRFKRVV